MTDQEKTAVIVYNALTAAGANKIGACAMLGNMQAESALIANNAQDGMTKLTDEEYTTGVDNGTYSKFVTDSVGYGLCQWTYKTRKQALLAYAQNMGASISDTAMQAQFCLKELKESYSTVWQSMCNGTSISTVASLICTRYEQPAVNNTGVRTSYAQSWYDKIDSLIGGTVATLATVAASTTNYNVQLGLMQQGMMDTQVQTIQILLLAYGYSVDVTGTFDEKTKRAVMAFQSDFGLSTDGIVGKETWSKLLKG